MPTHAFIFDLDGTLADTVEDIAAAVNRTLVHHGAAPHPLAAYRDFVGAGAENLITRALGAGSPLSAAEVLSTYRQVYAEEMFRRSRPFPGVEPLLEGLLARGHPVAVLSNKPHAATVRMVEVLFGRFQLAPVFGDRPGVPRKPDPQSALEVASLLGRAPAECLFVGDTGIDMETACRAGMVPVGVGWGFRPEELEGSGARHRVSRPEDILCLVG
ncbi:MAG: HAD family hydrolase [Deltaproteobacteria bacterium]|nr:HAD family hydrolase [Deltaproteobacteria bacterium]